MHFPRFRIFTWIILIINVLFLIWIITGISSRPSATAALDLKTCQAASDAGTGIGVFLIIFLWVAADIILGIIWLITRKKTRDCPTCGHSVRKGVTTCPKCGTDFRQLYGAPQSGQYQQSGGQYPPQSGGQYPPQSGGQYPPQSGGQYPPQSGGSTARKET